MSFNKSTFLQHIHQCEEEFCISREVSYLLKLININENSVDYHILNRYITEAVLDLEVPDSPLILTCPLLCKKCSTQLIKPFKLVGCPSRDEIQFLKIILPLLLCERCYRSYFCESKHYISMGFCVLSKIFYDYHPSHQISPYSSLTSMDHINKHSISKSNTGIKKTKHSLYSINSHSSSKLSNSNMTPSNSEVISPLHINSSSSSILSNSHSHKPTNQTYEYTHNTHNTHNTNTVIASPNSVSSSVPHSLTVTTTTTTSYDHSNIPLNHNNQTTSNPIQTNRLPHTSENASNLLISSIPSKQILTTQHDSHSFVPAASHPSPPIISASIQRTSSIPKINSEYMTQPVTSPDSVTSPSGSHVSPTEYNINPSTPSSRRRVLMITKKPSSTHVTLNSPNPLTMNQQSSNSTVSDIHSDISSLVSSEPNSIQKRMNIQNNNHHDTKIIQNIQTNLSKSNINISSPQTPLRTSSRPTRPSIPDFHKTSLSSSNEKVICSFLVTQLFSPDEISRTHRNTLFLYPSSFTLNNVITREKQEITFKSIRASSIERNNYRFLISFYYLSNDIGNQLVNRKPDFYILFDTYDKAVLLLNTILDYNK